MIQFKEYKLGDVCLKITDGAHFSPKEEEAGLPMASVKDLTDFGVNISSCKRISEIDFRNLVNQGCSPEYGDVLIAKDGNSSLDTVCVYKQSEKIVLLSSVAILKPNSLIKSAYLKYYLSNIETKSFLKDNFRSGSAIPRIVLKDFKRVPIKLPDLPTQTRIASILSSLDDKIELNRRTNATLEAIAQALFKKYFVDDIDPANLPEGWRTGTLGEVCENFDSKRVPLSSREREIRRGVFPYYGAASLMDYVDDFLFEGLHILLGEDGSVIDEKGFAILQYVWGQFWVNNHAHVLKGKNEVSTNHLYMILKNTSVSHLVTGAVQPKINQGNLNNLSIIIPKSAISIKYSNEIDELFALVRNNIDQIKKLEAIRDLLLPQLMSGEIDVFALEPELVI